MWILHSSSRALLLAAAGWLIVPTALGQQTWRRCYGGPGQDDAVCVRACPDGGYVVAGSTGSPSSGSGDIYLLRLEDSGTLRWARAIGGMGVEVGAGCDALEDGFIVAGSAATESDGYDMTLIRTDGEGAVAWQRYYGGGDWDLCEGVAAISGGFVLFGRTFSGETPQGAGIVIRADAAGEPIWTYRHADARPSAFTGLVPDAAGALYLSGWVDSDAQQRNGLVARIDAAGGLLWAEEYGGDSIDWFEDVALSPAGPVAIGSTRSGGTVQRIVLAAFGMDGGLLWDRFIGNTSDAGGAAICRAHGDGFAITGYNTLNAGARDMIFTRTDAAGWFQVGNNFGDGRPADGLSVTRASDGGYVVVGWIESIGPGPRSAYVVKTDGNGQTQSLAVVCQDDLVGVSDAQEPSIPGAVVPNPVTAGDAVRLQGFQGATRYALLDASGRLVLHGSLSDGHAVIPLMGVRGGAYVLRLTGDDGSLSHRRLVIH